MADGNNLIIGRLNQGDNVTLLDRNGVPPTVAFAVSNANGNGILGTATSATSSFIGVVGQSASGIGVLADGQTGLKSRGVQGNGIETDSGSGFGLLARSKSSTGVQATGKLFGVEAFSNGRDLAAGVRGTAVRGVLGFGSEIGVAGTVNTTAGTLTSAFVGVSGRSNSSHGVFGGSTAPILPGPLVGGVTGVSNQNGLLGESTGTAFGVFGRSRNGVGVGVSPLLRRRLPVGSKATSPCLATSLSQEPSPR